MNNSFIPIRIRIASVLERAIDAIDREAFDWLVCVGTYNCRPLANFLAPAWRFCSPSYRRLSR
jgi:hypothetical protein